MATEMKIKKPLRKKVKKSIQSIKKEVFESEIIGIKIENKLQKKAIEVICKLLGLHFEKIISSTSKEEESPYDPEFVQKIKESDEDIKAGRTRRIKDLKDIWNVV